jgi:hypothetical protein
LANFTRTTIIGYYALVHLSYFLSTFPHGGHEFPFIGIAMQRIKISFFLAICNQKSLCQPLKRAVKGV